MEMGMTIDEAIKEIESITVVTDEKQALAFALAVHTMKKYQMLQADYEARLKADMIAMLTEIQLQMEEYEPKWAENEDQVIASNRTWDDFDDIIQQKINALRAESEET